MPTTSDPTAPTAPGGAVRGRAITLLLPPSEGKAMGGRRGRPWTVDDGRFGERLGPSRRKVVEALAAVDGGDARLLGVSGPHLDRAGAANRLLEGAPTLPAWQRYTGVVWEHLDPGTLPAPARRSIVVVSGLLGLVRGDDPVPDYRLKMGASLPPMGKLSTWWRALLSETLAAGSARRFVVDLLPNEHRAALDLHGVRGVAVTFRDRRGGSGGHAAKAAKGRLARHLLLNGGDVAGVVAAYDDPDFTLDVVPL